MLNDNKNVEREKKEIPQELVNYEGRQYRFLVARFRIAGDANLYFSEDLINDSLMISKILSIEGQMLLREVF